MADYDLLPDEVVLLKADRMARGGKRLAAATNELILTNLHLIWIGRGMLGNVKGVEKFPLGLVKVHDYRAQALLTADDYGVPRLEVFFHNGHEAFRFPVGMWAEAERWVVAINQGVTGNDTAATSPTVQPPSGAAAVVANTISQFKIAFGLGVPGHEVGSSAVDVKRASG